MATSEEISPSRKYGHFKLVLLGDSAVGKSSIVQRFVKNSFDEFRESTIGAAFVTKTIQLDENTTVKFEIWDTAGQERYKSLAPMYYRNANGAIVVFDLTDLSSFEKAKKWVKELELQAPPELIVKLVGNKSDLKDQPSSNTIDEGIIQEFAQEKNFEFIETSAKTGENIEKIFRLIAEDFPSDKFQLQSTSLNEPENGVIDLSKPTSTTKACNC